MSLAQLLCYPAPPSPAPALPSFLQPAAAGQSPAGCPRLGAPGARPGIQGAWALGPRGRDRPAQHPVATIIRSVGGRRIADPFGGFI